MSLQTQDLRTIGKRPSGLQGRRRTPLPTVTPAELAHHGTRLAAHLWRLLIARPPAIPLNADLKTRLHRSFDVEFRSGARILLLTFCGFGVWGGIVPLSGAVIVPGSVVSETSSKKIQHPAGGVVAQIAVRDGDHVGSGDLLLRLDETVTRSNLQMLQSQLNAIRARVARLVAERDGSPDLTLPKELAAAANDPDMQPILASERSLFQARSVSRVGQRDVLTGRIGQLDDQIHGLDAQIQSQKAQRDLIAEELKGIETLYAKSLVPLSRLSSLQREAARIDGVQGQLLASVAETQGKMGEAKLQVARLDQDFRADVMKELRESQEKEAELVERVVAARDLMARTDLRAPTSGTVHQLSVHTVGGVISPAEVLMVIVPDHDELQIEAHLPVRDIEQVQVGQGALVRLAALNQRTTPELNGRVTFVSADATHDPQSNSAFYTVRVGLTPQEVERLGGPHLIAGMPAELFLHTESRTVIGYLLKPIREQLSRTFRER